MSFPVSPKHCLSCSSETLKEHDRQRPPKPISSKVSLSAPDVSSAWENLGLELNVCSSACADFNVEEFWQWRRTSSSVEIIGPHLGGMPVSTQTPVTVAVVVGVSLQTHENDRPRRSHLIQPLEGPVLHSVFEILEVD